MLHPVFVHTRDALAAATQQGALNSAALAQALGAIGHGEKPPLPDDAALADAIVRLGALLFVRAPRLDGRYVVLGPMQVGVLADGQRTPVDVVDELIRLETAAGGDDAELDALLQTRGEALLQRTLAAVGDRAEAWMADRASQLDAQVDQAISEGRWQDVPLDGPDAEVIRAALRFLPRDRAAAVVRHWRAADRALGAGEAATAMRELDAAAALVPDLFETWVRRARALLLEGDRVRAGADVERAIGLNAAAGQPRAIRAELRTIIRDLPGALEDWEAAVKAAPAWGRFRLGRGYTRIAAGKLREATQDFDEARRLMPDDPVPAYALADAQIRAQDVRGAISTYDALLARSPDDEQARLNRGTARLMAGDAPGAVEDLSAVVAHRPLEPMPWMRRGIAQLRAREPWQAWVDGLTALAVAPDDWAQEDQALQVLGAAHRSLDAAHPPNAADVAARADVLRRRATGRELLRLAERLGAHLPAEGVAWHLLRAGLFHEHGRWEAAASAADEGLAVDPDHAGLLLLRGRALVGAGQPGPALAALDRAATRAFDLDAADTFELHFARARAAGMQGRLADALAAFAEAGALQPHRADVWFYRGVHLDLAGDPMGAIAAYTDSLGRNPTFSAAWFNRACEHAVTGDAESALADLSQAIRLDPKWREEAKTEAYFEQLRGDLRFRTVVGGD